MTVPTILQRDRAAGYIEDNGLYCSECGWSADRFETADYIESLYDAMEPYPYLCPACTVKAGEAA